MTISQIDVHQHTNHVHPPSIKVGHNGTNSHIVLAFEGLPSVHIDLETAAEIALCITAEINSLKDRA